MNRCHLQNMDGARGYLKSEGERQISLSLMTQLKGMCVHLVTQSRLTLGDPRDCSPPGSCAHGIFQARILEQVAMPPSMGSSRPRDRTLISYVFCVGRQILYQKCHLGGLYAELNGVISDLYS